MERQLSGKSLARLLGISKQRISELAAAGKLRPIRLGRDTLYDVTNPVNAAWLRGRLPGLDVVGSSVPEIAESDPEDVEVDARSEDDDDFEEERTYSSDEVIEFIRACHVNAHLNIESGPAAEKIPQAAAKLAKEIRGAKTAEAATRLAEKALTAGQGAACKAVRQSYDFLSDGFEKGTLDRMLDELVFNAKDFGYPAFSYDYYAREARADAGDPRCTKAELAAAKAKAEAADTADKAPPNC